MGQRLPERGLDSLESHGRRFWGGIGLLGEEAQLGVEHVAQGSEMHSMCGLGRAIDLISGILLKMASYGGKRQKAPPATLRHPFSTCGHVQPRRN